MSLHFHMCWSSDGAFEFIWKKSLRSPFVDEKHKTMVVISITRSRLLAVYMYTMLLLNSYSPNITGNGRNVEMHRRHCYWIPNPPLFLEWKLYIGDDDHLSRLELFYSASEVESWMGGGKVAPALLHSVTSIILYFYDSLAYHVFSITLSATFY